MSRHFLPRKILLETPATKRRFYSPFVTALALCIGSGCGGPSKEPVSLQVYRSVDSFELVDQSGNAFSSATLAGKVWVANFIFTSCTAECLVLSRRMQQLQEHFAGNKDVAFVSFSVDPQTDTPERLLKYATTYDASDDWTFLTGDVEKLDTLVKTSFLLPVARDPAERAGVMMANLVHSNRLAVVDRSGTVRFYQDGLEPNAVDRLVEAVDKALEDPS